MTYIRRRIKVRKGAQALKFTLGCEYRIFYQNGTSVDFRVLGGNTSFQFEVPPGSGKLVDWTAVMDKPYTKVSILRCPPV